jgi:hypothetical protein
MLYNKNIISYDAIHPFEGSNSMICKKCGTQTAGALFCTHCGAILYDDKEESTLHTGENAAASVPVRQERAVPKKKGRVLRFGRLVLPALLLFYPLVYFFVDLFIQLPDALLGTGENGNLLLNPPEAPYGLGCELNREALASVSIDSSEYEWSGRRVIQRA